MPEAATAAVLFDWGDTLIRFPGLLSQREAHLSCVDRAVGELARDGCPELAGLDREALLTAYAEVGVHLIERSERSGREHRFEQRLQGTLERIGADPAPETIARLARAIAEIIAAQAELVEGAAAVLEALCGRMRLGLVSNYPSALTVHESLRRFELDRRLDTVVVSETVGWLKPHRRPFEQAFAATGTHPAEVLFVGNDLNADMRGARAAGCRTAWLAPEHRATERNGDVDIHLPRLCELPGHLGI